MKPNFASYFLLLLFFCLKNIVSLHQNCIIKDLCSVKKPILHAVPN